MRLTFLEPSRSRSPSRHRWVWPALAVATLGLLGSLSCEFEIVSKNVSTIEDTTGIDIDIVNGQFTNMVTGKPAPLVLAAGRKFHVNQFRMQVHVPTYPAEDVIDWVKEQTEFSVLDWAGLEAVNTEVEKLRTGTWNVDKYYQEAKWMAKLGADQRITLAFLDADKKVVSGPVTIIAQDFVMPRATFLTRAELMPKKDDLGTNTGHYEDIRLVAAGPYKGPKDDIYIVTVTKGGLLDGSTTTGAQVTVTSMQGDAGAAAETVKAGTPIPLGAAGYGAKLTFYETNTGTRLLSGDKWTIRCAARTGEVEEPEEGIKANLMAMGEIRFTDPMLRTGALFSVPSTAKQIQVTWQFPAKKSEGTTGGQAAATTRTYTGPVEVIDKPAFDYGLDVVISTNTPKNKSYYMPGEVVDITFDVTDRQGKSLLTEVETPDPSNPDKKIKTKYLPSYYEFRMEGDGKGTKAGLTYFMYPTLPHGWGLFNEYRPYTTMAQVSGPKHLLRQNKSNLPPTAYFEVNKLYPEKGSVINAGERDPNRWKPLILPRLAFQLPKTVQAGTYVIMVKIERAFLGEHEHIIKTMDIQVGTSVVTKYNQTTGNCNVCHRLDGALERLRHGMKDDFLCLACHNPSFGTTPEIMHALHFHSPLYPQHRNDCSLCHLLPRSNSEASPAICGSCHEDIHSERTDDPNVDPYAPCGSNCHSDEPAGHIPLPPL